MFSARRIIIVMAGMFLLPVGAGAGELQYDKETGGCISLQCTKDIISRHPLSVESQASLIYCYAKMREAMKKMDEHYYNTPVVEHEKQTEQQRWLNKHWREVMKECVQ
jgi:hypothetical protein